MIEHRNFDTVTSDSWLSAHLGRHRCTNWNVPRWGD